MRREKVLILIPGENARGGITNYYASIRKHLPENIIYFYRGSRNWPKKKNVFAELYRIISDYLNFIYIVLFKNISLIQTTTAFYKGSIIRDGIFLLIAQIFSKKTIVFFRGWNDNYAHGLSGLSLKLFKLVYFKTNAIIDLSEGNIAYLKKLGYKNKLYLETTVVDNELIAGIGINKLIDSRLKSTKKILFLSRIEKEKGIYKLLETYRELKTQDDCFQLIFAGDGNELKNLKERVKKENIADVDILGFVKGKEKRRLFEEARIFVFLSDFEGMPNAVLEAMAFGLPVITTDVGGIASVFTDEINGYLLDEYNKDDLQKKINKILNNHLLYEEISKRNYNDMQRKVLSDIVAKRMLGIFDIVMEN